MVKLNSKLPNVGTTIFTEMSALSNEYNALNLSQGFPNYEPDEKLRELVSFYINNGKNQYAPMSGVQALRESIAHKIKNIYNIPINPNSEITVTAGGTQAIFTSILAFVNKGDEVIVVEPAFDCYNPAIELVGGIIVPYEMKSPEFQIDWQELQKLISDKTRMLIINTPHNPSGSILKNEDFEKLEIIIKNKNIIVLSDEVYEHLIFDGEKHCSILKYPTLFKQSIAVFSFGKTFHCTGWKVGYAVMPSNLMEEFRKVHQFNVFSVNSFVQHALADYLKDSEHYNYLPNFYQQKRDLLSSYINKSRLKLIPSRGSYFVLCDYSAVSNLPDKDFSVWMTKEKKLASIPISVFYSSGKQEKLIRFCFAKTEDLLHQAGQIIEKL